MEVDGFRTECRLDDGQTLFLLAWLEIDGSFPRSAHFANRYRLRSSNSYGGPLMRSRIFKKERAAIGSLWPLKVGRDVQYSTKFETRGIPGAPSYGRTSSHVKVESTDSIIAGDSEWRTFVIVVGLFQDSKLYQNSRSHPNFQGAPTTPECTDRLYNISAVAWGFAGGTPISPCAHGRLPQPHSKSFLHLCCTVAWQSDPLRSFSCTSDFAVCKVDPVRGLMGHSRHPQGHSA